MRRSLPTPISCAALVLAVALPSLACNTLFPAEPTPGVVEVEDECDLGQVDFVLGAEDNARTLSLAPGETFAIGLTANASTGYEWAIEPFDESLLRFDGSASTYLSAVPGSQGADRYCFTALAPGTTDLSLIYHRPWERGIPPIETFRVTLDLQ